MEEPEAFERAIAHYLQAGLHEKRGMSADAYRARCQELWDACQIDERCPYRLLIDELMPTDDAVAAGGYDYDDERIKEVLDSERAVGSELPDLRCVAAGLFDAGGRAAPSERDDDQNTLAPRPWMLGFFDVLGFRSWLDHVGLDAVLRAYRQLIDEAVTKPSLRCAGIREIAPGEGVPVLFALPTHSAHFSDTIVVWAPLDPLFVGPFLQRCADIICEALSMGIALRGAVSIGSAVMDQTTGTYLGDPIVEAAEHEHAQDWLGACMCPSTNWPEYQRQLLFDTSNVILYDAPLKSSADKCESHVALDWPRRWRETQKLDVDAAIDALDTDERFGRYYENARLFADHSTQNEDWFERHLERERKARDYQLGGAPPESQ